MSRHAQCYIVTVNLSIRMSGCLYCIEMNAHVIQLFPLSGRSMSIFI